MFERIHRQKFRRVCCVEYTAYDYSPWTPDCLLPVCKPSESRPISRRIAVRNTRQTVLRVAETHERRLACTFNCGTVDRSDVTTSMLHSTKHEHSDFTTFVARNLASWLSVDACDLQCGVVCFEYWPQIDYPESLHVISQSKGWRCKWSIKGERVGEIRVTRGAFKF